MELQIITRKQAKEQGLQYYFSGILCKKKHLSPRYVSSRNCVVCTNEKAINWNKTNSELVKSNNIKRYKTQPYKLRVKEYNLQKRYNLSYEDYIQLLDSQNNCCAICYKSDTQLCVDHCHTTGIVRGLLCNDCNLALGRVFDSKQILENMIKYLS